MLDLVRLILIILCCVQVLLIVDDEKLRLKDKVAKLLSVIIMTLILKLLRGV